MPDHLEMIEKHLAGRRSDASAALMARIKDANAPGERWSGVDAEADRLAGELEDWAVHITPSGDQAVRALSVATMLRVRAGGKARRGRLDWMAPYGNREAGATGDTDWEIVKVRNGFGLIIARWDKPDWRSDSIEDLRRAAEEIDARPSIPGTAQTPGLRGRDQPQHR